jgi:hypothetical protein
MTASSQFGEFELDRSRFELRHKGDNSRLVGKPYRFKEPSITSCSGRLRD